MKISLELAIEIADGYESEDFIRVATLPTDDQGKYQYERFVFLCLSDKKFYMFEAERSGSYFSEFNWKYDEDSDGMVELTEVVMKPVVGFTWERKQTK